MEAFWSNNSNKRRLKRIPSNNLFAWLANWPRFMISAKWPGRLVCRGHKLGAYFCFVIFFGGIKRLALDRCTCLLCRDGKTRAAKRQNLFPVPFDFTHQFNWWKLVQLWPVNSHKLGPRNAHHLDQRLAICLTSTLKRRNLKQTLSWQIPMGPRSVCLASFSCLNSKCIVSSARELTICEHKKLRLWKVSSLRKWTISSSSFETSIRSLAT